MAKKPRRFIPLLARSIKTVAGVVLIWRGIWYVLDYLDLTLFNDRPLYTAIGGIALGLVLLYVPDRDFKELDQL